MILKEYNIRFTCSYENQLLNINSYNNEYRNLMVLIKDKICPDDFGQCGGQGRCGTCLVKVCGSDVNDRKFYRNEESTILKMGITDPDIRLSCQIQVNADLENVAVQVIDNI